MAHLIDNLMQKEVTRKEFLAMAGLGIASLLGLSRILNLLTSKNKQVSSGYGASVYGGGRK
jgi:hypothetical protein